MVWLAHNSVREMVKIEPANNFAMTRFENGALFTLTDFTGAVRRLASGQGTYEFRLNVTRRRGSRTGPRCACGPKPGSACRPPPSVTNSLRALSLKYRHHDPDRLIMAVV